MIQKEAEGENIDNSADKSDELLPLSRISHFLKLATNKKFTKASAQLIQQSATNFVKEISELSEKQSRIRSKKMDTNQSVTIQKEDVISAIQKGGKKFGFINFSTEFLDDCFWCTESNEQ